MAFLDKARNESRRLRKSFYYAGSGIWSTVRNEKNMQIHVFVAAVAVFLSFLLDVSRLEWLAVISLIGGIFALEMVNTALEKTVDLVTAEFHPLAKAAKDIAAGAVLIFAVVSVIAGCIIFIPRLLELF